MNAVNPVLSIVESLREKGSVTTVYGDPIVTGDRTTIPVARVAYGFGGGYGTTTDGATGIDVDDGLNEAVPTEEGDERGNGGEGGGMGGGIVVTPVGVVDISATGTRFVRFDQRRRLLGALVLGIVVGLVLGRRARD